MRIYLKYFNYVIAAFKYSFNARVHTKYSEVSPPRDSAPGRPILTFANLYCILVAHFVPIGSVACPIYEWPGLNVVVRTLIFIFYFREEVYGR